MIFKISSINWSLVYLDDRLQKLIAVKSHFKALGLYNFKRGFGWAYKRGGLISRIIYSFENGWAYIRGGGLKSGILWYLFSNAHFVVCFSLGVILTDPETGRENELLLVCTLAVKSICSQLF